RGQPRLTPRVEAIIADPHGHAAAMALLRIPLQLFAGLAMVLWASGMRGEAGPGWVSAAIGLTAASAMVWVFNVLVPQAVARHGAERTILASSGLIRATRTALGPFGVVVRFTDEVVRRLAGADIQ